jgi:ATP-dependent DNA helicase DinG
VSDCHSEELLENVFSKGGILQSFLQDFEERPQQKEMAAQILNAYLHNQIALVEAGTGTGKSLAYLFPAVHWALKFQEKTVISTHTIALQEQLIYKDIPFLLNALGVQLKASLVKGMSNYVCLRKYHDLQMQSLFLTDAENEEMERIDQWLSTTEEGSRSSIAFSNSPFIWERISAEAGACNHIKCPYYKKCFFFQARKEIAEAQILVVNHHLLLADISAKEKNDGKSDKSVLPSYKRIVVDEAHHLEEVALECLSKRIDRIELYHLLTKVHNESNIQNGRLGMVRQVINHLISSQASLFQRLDVHIPAEKMELLKKIDSAFLELESYAQIPINNATQAKIKERKLRIQSEWLQQLTWKNQILPLFTDLSAGLKRFSQSLFSLQDDLEQISVDMEQLSTHCIELQAVAAKLEEKAEILENFFKEETDILRVRWIEVNSSKRGVNTVLVDSMMDVPSYLNSFLFEPLSSASLCSATLTTNQSFQFIRERCGIPNNSEERIVTEQIYESPFDYKERSLLVVPSDLPDPSEESYILSASDMIYKVVEASEGNAFVLFTSYEMLQACYQMIGPLIEKSGFSLLKQGDASRHLLIERFKAKDRSILFGTDSFWEGVDVAGEALRCVIIVKLPFKVPSDPLVQAFSDLLSKQNKDPFLDYMLPQAAMKFKQGFGRLIRKKNDRGCIVCLDKRLIKKAYGKVIIKSLPSCNLLFDRKDLVLEEMKKFYKKTKIGA